MYQGLLDTGKNQIKTLEEFIPERLLSFNFISLLIIAILIGMAKTGIHGTGFLAVPLLALIFGAKISTGIMLPILIFADFFGVAYYKQHTSWKYLITLIPWVIIGIYLGSLYGAKINEELFRYTMACIILIGVVIIYIKEKKKIIINNNLGISIIIGLLGGFTTMVGNIAGPVMSVYLLSMGLDKKTYIGTAAWFFLCVNIIKIPFHVYIWKTINMEIFYLDLLLLPGIIIGAIIGIKLVKIIPEYYYKKFIIIMTLLSAILMLN